MTDKRINLIKKIYGIDVDIDVLKKTDKFIELFIEYNSHTNLMSKNDIDVIFEKHILDSISVVLFDKFKDASVIVDVGCGGGFPSVVLSVFFPDKKIYAIDSVSKKINFINLIKSELELYNLFPLLTRVEDYPPLGADIITNRAVGKIKDIWKYSKKHLNSGGYFISYKAKTADDEALDAMKSCIELKDKKIIDYELPLKENHTRKLVIFKNG